MIESNGLFLRLSSLNGKDIEYVLNAPKRFNLREAEKGDRKEHFYKEVFAVEFPMS